MTEERDVSAAWQGWIAENLLRGAERAALVRELCEEGLAEPEAALVVERVASSPILEAALPFARESRRLRAFARLDRARWQGAREPSDVERIAWPGVEVFLSRYWATGAPVVFEGLVSRWPAMTRWSLAELERRFGDAEVAVTDARESDPDYDMHHERHTKRMSLSALLARIRSEPTSNDFYMVANNKNVYGPLAGMLEDVVWPEGLTHGDEIPGSAIWIGPGGTITPLHHDTSNILFCQVVGRKRFKLVAPMELGLLDGARDMYAGVDPDAPDLERFPWWKDVLVREVTLEPGDALFLPVGMWHHVRALSPSVSLARNGFDWPNAFDWFVPSRH